MGCGLGSNHKTPNQLKLSEAQKQDTVFNSRGFATRSGDSVENSGYQSKQDNTMTFILAHNLITNDVQHKPGK